MSENLLEVVKKGESEEIELKKSTAQLERALKSVCGFLNHKGGRVYFGIQKIGVTGRETKYILTRHEPAINLPYPSTNMKYDKEERRG